MNWMKTRETTMHLLYFVVIIVTEENGRKLKNIHIDLILKKNCSFSLYLKFGISKWKCDFTLPFLI